MQVGRIVLDVSREPISAGSPNTGSIVMQTYSKAAPRIGKVAPGRKAGKRSGIIERAMMVPRKAAKRMQRGRRG